MEEGVNRGGYGSWGLMLAYTALYMSTVLINKYVLSVLRFTYPTIFQSWQMFVGAVILQALTVTQKIDITPSLFNTKREAVAQWMPAVCLHVVSIYSGSVALSQLHVPVFVVCHTCVGALTSIYQGLIKHFSWRSYYNIIAQCLLLLTTCLAILTDPDSSLRSYVWMLLHIISSVGYSIYELTERYTIKLAPLERLYCNYIFSFLLLAPCCYLMGDLGALGGQLEFFTLYRFYVGCVLSGVCGAVFSMCGLLIGEAGPTPVTALCPEEVPAGEDVSKRQLLAMSKLLLVLASLFVYEINFHPAHAIWLLVSLLLLVIVEVPFKEINISMSDTHET